MAIWYRIARKEFGSKLHPSGFANRWNKKGEQVIYAGSSKSLCTLESIVHQAALAEYAAFHVLVIRIDCKKSQIQNLTTEDLPANWRTLQGYAATQRIGSNWYTKSKFLAMEIPSVVVPKESNLVLNTKHPDFASHVHVEIIEPFFWDDRVMLKSDDAYLKTKR